MSSKLPKTKFVRYRKKSGSIPDWANPEFFQYNAPSQIESYRISCEGDSGSGQIFATKYTDRQTRVEHKKFVLSAVLTAKGSEYFYVNKFFFGGKSYRLPCGAYTYSKKNTENTSKKCQLAKKQRFRKYSIGLNDKSQRNHI